MGCCDDHVEIPADRPPAPVRRSGMAGEGSVMPQGNHALLAWILPKGYPAEVESDGTLIYTDWQESEPPGHIEGFRQQQDLVSYQPLWDACAKRELKFILKPGCHCLNIVATCFNYGGDHFLKVVTFADCTRCNH